MKEQDKRTYEDWADISRYLNKRMAEGDQENKSESTEILRGAAFLQRCMRLAGITEEEINLFESWEGFYGAYKDKPNEAGFARAEKLIREIIEYRDVTLDDIRHRRKPIIWEWESSMAFQAINLIDRVPTRNGKVYGIYLCKYKGEEYYFGIGKEEPTITEDMIKNGEWSEYTWTD